ncbi:MAG: hypothetical protein IKD71_08820, partial [Solobacterium sp.]|nr:hypothetical protein [Solobacterium sp.]
PPDDLLIEEQREQNAESSSPRIFIFLLHSHLSVQTGYLSFINDMQAQNPVYRNNKAGESV